MGVAHQTHLAPCFGQSGVGVVLAQLQTELGSAGEHAVGLGHALGHQVVHHHAQVGLVAAGQPSAFTATLQRGVHTREQALGRRLFVAGGAIDLTSKKQALDLARLETVLQRARVKVVVFDGVARAQDVGVLHAGHAAHEGELDVKRQAGGDAVGVNLVGRQALGLQKNLVAVFVGKAVDLVFHAGAVARPHPLDLAGEHGAAVKARADDVVGALVGVGDPARHLARVHLGPAHEAEHRYGLVGGVGAGHAVTGLLGALRVVDAAPVDARWGTGFQAALGQLELFEAGGQTQSRRITGPTGGVVVQTDVDLAVQKCASGEHHGAAAKAHAHLGDGTDHPVALDHQVVHRLLKKPQIRLVLQHAADGGFVQDAIGLCTRGAHGRALAAVEDAELDATFVGGQGHGATQSVDLFDQMAFSDAADRGVATHLPQGFNVVS